MENGTILLRGSVPKEEHSALPSALDVVTRKAQLGDSSIDRRPDHSDPLEAEHPDPSDDQRQENDGGADAEDWIDDEAMPVYSWALFLGLPIGPMISQRFPAGQHLTKREFLQVLDGSSRLACA